MFTRVLPISMYGVEDREREEEPGERRSAGRRR